jgi:23S rRNA (cytidine2498-2'-O)-methyltransferase
MDKQTLIENLKQMGDKRLDNCIIFSGNVYTFESALNEMIALGEGVKLVKWLSSTTALVYVPQGVAATMQAMRDKPPIYIQHIYPVQYVLDMSCYDDIDRFAKAISEKVDSQYTEPFSVQTSIYDKESELKAFDVNRTVSDILTLSGMTQDTKDPYWVVSVSIDDGMAYIGISTAKDNMSKWACGKVYYQKDFNRAEYKLLECMDYFHIEVKGGNALDLGAAPGGWTKALASRGCKVWAVDPAELDEDILHMKGVTHIKKSAQHFIKDNDIRFNIIVNDMILDCRESAKIQNDVADSLHPNGFCIMTAKLPKQGYNKRLKTAIKILESRYAVAGVRQLPSNKSEVTVLLYKK